MYASLSAVLYPLVRNSSCWKIWKKNKKREKMTVDNVCLQRNQRWNCQHLLDHQKSREFQKNINFCFIDYAKAFDCVDHIKEWKILKEMRIPDHLTCVLRNLYTGQEVIVRTRHGTTDWFQIGKGVCQGCILSPCLCNLYAEDTRWNAGLDEWFQAWETVSQVALRSCFEDAGEGVSLYINRCLQQTGQSIWILRIIVN